MANLAYPAASREAEKRTILDPSCPFLIPGGEALEGEKVAGSYLTRTWVLIDATAHAHASDPAVLAFRAKAAFEADPPTFYGRGPDPARRDDDETYAREMEEGWAAEREVARG